MTGMTDQGRLRRHITSLERLQAQRVEQVARMKVELDKTVELKQREIDNLKAQVTVKGAGTGL